MTGLGLDLSTILNLAEIGINTAGNIYMQNNQNSHSGSYSPDIDLTNGNTAIEDHPEISADEKSKAASAEKQKASTTSVIIISIISIAAITGLILFLNKKNESPK